MPRCNDGDILCPFYMTRTLKSITCEGITDDCVTKLMFTTIDRNDFHRNLFCNNRYKNCEIYRMLEKKYED